MHLKGKLGDVIGMFPGNYCSPLEKGVGLQAIYDYGNYYIIKLNHVVIKYRWARRQRIVF